MCSYKTKLNFEESGQESKVHKCLSVCSVCVRGLCVWPSGLCCSGGSGGGVGVLVCPGGGSRFCNETRCKDNRI